MTLRQAIEHTISVRQPKTDEYRSSLHLHFKVWLDRPVRELTEDEVERVFEDLMLAGKRRTAVKVVTLLGTVLRTVRRRCALGDIVATQFLADEGRLPTFGRKSCSWETDEQFTAVIEAVRAYPNAHLVNMALLQCFTGMRLGETRRLRWDAINLKHRHLVVRETKSGTVLVLPLCPIHVDLLNEQQSLASNLKLDTVRAGQVFPALRRGTKVPFIQEVQELYHHVRKETGIHASSHDWRRWFISVGATLNDVPPDMRRRLTNHVNGEDAHQGYILGHAEQLRPAMVAITSKLVALADLTKHQ
jgi:integrase